MRKAVFPMLIVYLTASVRFRCTVTGSGNSNP